MLEFCYDFLDQYFDRRDFELIQSSSGLYETSGAGASRDSSSVSFFASQGSDLIFQRADNVGKPSDPHSWLLAKRKEQFHGIRLTATTLPHLLIGLRASFAQSSVQNSEAKKQQ